MRTHDFRGDVGARRPGDRIAIASYPGEGDMFDQAIAEFSAASSLAAATRGIAPRSPGARLCGHDPRLTLLSISYLRIG
jgi:hypothetical protein